MMIQVLKSKIHNVKITFTELNYIGSITVDEALLDAANMIENEKVLIVNNTNGERIETYIIKGERGSGIVGLNGAAARRGMIGDELIIISFAVMDFELAKTHKPWLVFPNKFNKI
ncbi:MAG: aspartate 1-decarboxylase [Bacteroidetes bacterium]|nr:aspartate 1-decarboxylase [Bacteroidota bacterium]